MFGLVQSLMRIDLLLVTATTPFIAGNPPKTFLRPLICNAGVIASAIASTSGEIRGQRHPA